jgi:hypothetical protein
MARFKTGDKVTVNGIEMNIQTWPHDDDGFFTATYTLRDGEHYTTHHVTVLPEAAEAPKKAAKKAADAGE